MTSPIPWTKIKALSFDIYGTLLDWETGHFSTAHSTLLSPYLPTSKSTFLLGVEPHDTAVQASHPTWLQRDIIAEGLRRYCTSDLALLSSGKITEAQLQHACREYGAAIPSYRAFDDTVAAIQRLGKRYKLVPLSNIDNLSFGKALEGSLRGCGFDAVYTAEDIGSYKPDRRNFEYLLRGVRREFGVDKGELVHVAQSLFHDHRPAKEMGLLSVWVDRKGVMGELGRTSGEDFGYKLKVDSLAELADIVERAFAEEGKEGP